MACQCGERQRERAHERERERDGENDVSGTGYDHSSWSQECFAPGDQRHRSAVLNLVSSESQPNTCNTMNLRLQTAAQITVLFLLQLCFQNEVETATLPLRCQCVRSINGLNPKMIKNFDIFPKTAHCSKIEIILTVHQGHEESEACLNPESRQGKRLQKCWERSV
ncbi:hypothetical protein chiPu_0006999 [Chiloscyllium punctatum]|uniref:Chemokine interleukin-8-like domain-containing protein n=1 Tax=Chiloscyllium punctatum TaxID=137246 RepID=A0A401SDV0_CHIPU|nr:hypothetical protein [Chiloscyllium punctatum]